MNWVKEIEGAQTVEAVLDLVNEYVAEQADAFWDRVPAIVRPDAVESEDALHVWHHRMVHELTIARQATLELQDVCVVFLRASVRVHQINLREAAPGRSSNDGDLSLAPLRRGSRRM
jgi:hypothetical protein